jgi:hypothetical protein
MAMHCLFGVLGLAKLSCFRITTQLATGELEIAMLFMWNVSS